MQFNHRQLVNEKANYRMLAKTLWTCRVKHEELTGRVSLLTCQCGNRGRRLGNMSDPNTDGCREGNVTEQHWQRLEYVSAAIDRHCSPRSNDKFRCRSAAHSQCAIENHVCAHRPRQTLLWCRGLTMSSYRQVSTEKIFRCVQCYALHWR